jgi:hypothetical protein
MAETKEFPTADVLGTITGKLLGDIGGIYLVLNWMTGESVFTHQLPRISREARPVILALRPELQQAIDEAEQVNRENVLEWRDRWNARYGTFISVPKFATEMHERIDPISELAEMVRPEKIVVISSSERDADA